MRPGGDTELYLGALGDLGPRLAADPEWMRPIREAAIARFREIGFPTTREEDWKYTNVGPWVGTRPGASLRPDASPTPRAIPAIVGETDVAARLVFVDGRFAADASTVAALPPGCRVGRLSDAIAAGDPEVGRHLARHASFDANGFTALSTALLQDGAFVVLPDRAIVEKPIEVVFAASSHGAEPTAYPRLLVVCGRESQATLVELHRAESGSGALANSVGEIVLGDAAALGHVRVVDDAGTAAHIATTEVVQGRDSRYASSSLSIRGKFVRQNLNVRLAGEGAACSLDGLYLAAGRDFVDNHTFVDHVVPHCTSRELYKGILAGSSRAVFNGKVIVQPSAQKSDAQQTNRNLLLSGRAEIDTKPELQIFADDVKCAHGVAIGQLDEQALFYLKSRGIGETAGRHVLTLGFGNEMIERIGLAAVRPALERLLAERLDADLLEDR
jgi:Fe-S cluster assembly protein SufD